MDERLSRWLAEEGRGAVVMGILNVTPDSFSDGGRFIEPEAAAARAREMAAAGAAVIDIGAESTRPGAARVEAKEQLERLLPVLRILEKERPAVLSVDTTLSPVAEAALDHGVEMINDISAGLDDARMLELAGRRGAAVILMHKRGEPATMQREPVYADVVGEVEGHLRGRISAALEAGVPRRHILADPGIGFGKTTDHNLALLRETGRLARLAPLVVGVSRKRFLGEITGEGAAGGMGGQESGALRIIGGAAATAWAVMNGASMVRAHDVAPIAMMMRMLAAVKRGFKGAAWAADWGN